MLWILIRIASVCVMVIPPVILCGGCMELGVPYAIYTFGPGASNQASRL